MKGSPVNRLKSLWPHSEGQEDPGLYPQQTWTETAKTWEHDLEHYLGEHPKLTLAAAAAVGLLLGLLVKRK